MRSPAAVLLGLALIASVTPITNAWADPVTTLALDSGQSAQPISLTLRGASTSGVLVSRGGGSSVNPTQRVGNQALYAGGSTTDLPASFTGNAFGTGLVDSFASSDEFGPTGEHVAFDDLSTPGRTGSVPLADGNAYLSGAPDGWVEYEYPTHRVVHVRPTSVGDNATTSRSTLLATSATVRVAAANTSGVVIAPEPCNAACPTAAPLQFLPFNGGPARTLHDPLASLQRSAPSSTVTYAYGHDVVCPTDNDCFAVDNDGGVAHTSNAASPSPTWTVDAVAPGLLALSCPTATLCVASDFTGSVLTSAAPTGGKDTWVSSTVAQSTLSAVSCASATFCLASDYSGNVFTSSSPGTSGSWTASGEVGLPPASDVVGADCPVTTLCVLVTDSGRVYSSTAPSVAGSWTWKQVSSTGLASVSCPSTSFCSAVDYAGSVFTTTSPTGDWNLGPQLDGSGLTSVSCASPSACVAGSFSGNAYWSSAPTTSAWSSVTAVAELISVGCAVTTCAALSDSGSLAMSTSAGHTWSMRGPVTTPERSPIDGLACPSSQVCLAGDRMGALLSSADGGLSWSQPFKVDNSYLGHVVCASDVHCLAYGSQIAVSNDPTGGPAAWRLLMVDTDPFPYHYFVAAACPSVNLCVALDDASRTRYSTNPFAAEPVWSAPATHGSSTYGMALSCPTVSLCVAGTSGGLMTSASPATDTWSGVTAYADGDSWSSLSCPSANLCVATTSGGNVVRSTQPIGPASTWLTTESGNQAGVVSCPSVDLCVVVDTPGGIQVSETPASAGRSWSAPTGVDGKGLTAVSCVPGTAACRAGSSGGVVARAADVRQLEGRYPSRVDVDPVGDVAWAWRSTDDYSPSTPTAISRFVTSSASEVSRVSVACPDVTSLAVSQQRTVWNACRGGVAYATTAGLASSVLASAEDSSLASDGAAVYFTRSKSASDAGLYSFADASSEPTKIGNVGAQEPVTVANLALSPGRVVYADNDPAGAAQLPGIWSRTLTNSADGLTAGAPSLVPHTGSGLSLAISGTRMLTSTHTDPPLVVRTPAGSSPLDAQLGSTDVAAVRLSGTTGVVSQFGPEHPAFVVIDVASGQRREFTGQGSWVAADISGRYLDVLLTSGELRQIDLVTGSDAALAPVPQLPTGTHLNLATAQVSASGTGAAWVTEAVGDGGSHVAYQSAYVREAGEDPHPLTFDDEPNASVAMSHQYVVKTSEHGTRIVATRLTDGVSTTPVAVAPLGEDTRTPLSLDGNVLGYESADGSARLLQLPASGADPPAVLTQLAGKSLTTGGGRSWSADIVTSAPLVTCAFTFSSPSGTVASTPCDPDAMKVGEAVGSWNGTSSSGSISRGDLTWRLDATGADGVLRGSDLISTQVAGPLSVAPPITVTITAPSTTSEPFTLTLSSDGFTATGTNALLRDGAGKTVPTTLRCLTSAGSAASCAGPFRKFQLVPISPLVPGAGYSASLNPSGDVAGAVRDASGVAAVTTNGPATRVLTADDPTFVQSWAPARDPGAIGGSYYRESRAGATFSAPFTATTVRYFYVRGPDQGHVRVTIDGVVKDANLDQYARTRGYRLARTYAGLSTGPHTLTITVLGTRTSGSTNTFGAVDAMATGTSTCLSAAGCYSSGTTRWGTAGVTGALHSRLTFSDVQGASLTRTFTGTGFSLVRLQGPGQGQLTLVVDGRTIVTLNGYATRNLLSSYRSPAFSNGLHTLVIKVLHATGKAGTNAYGVGIDRLVAR